MGDILSAHNLPVIIGIAAGVLTAASMMPQVVKTIKTKKAEHVSVLMLIILIGGVTLWIVYGSLKKDMPIICTNIFSLLVNLTMLFLRWKYGDKRPR
ncbi:MAG TPA: SemiSWEET transporter [Parafilimonas sp.]|nr:SemiSWEET transporter [Parafilimonas sp.]